MIFRHMFSRRLTRLLVCAATIWLALPAGAETPGTLIRAADLKVQPFVDAASQASLPEGAAVSVVANRGGWSQVRAAGGSTGWVRLLNVRVNGTGSGNATQALSDLGGVLRTGTTQSTATTGAKGLTREDIQHSRPNPREVERLNNLQAHPVDIERFASSRQLAGRPVPEIKE